MTEFEVGKRVDVAKGKGSEKATIIEVSSSGKQLKVLFDSADEASVVSASKCTKARGRAPAAAAEKAKAMLDGGSTGAKTKKPAKAAKAAKPKAEKAEKPVRSVAKKKRRAVA